MHNILCKSTDKEIMVNQSKDKQKQKTFDKGIMGSKMADLGADDFVKYGNSPFPLRPNIYIYIYRCMAYKSNNS